MQKIIESNKLYKGEVKNNFKNIQITHTEFLILIEIHTLLLNILHKLLIFTKICIRYSFRISFTKLNFLALHFLHLKNKPRQFLRCLNKNKKKRQKIKIAELTNESETFEHSD